MKQLKEKADSSQLEVDKKELQKQGADLQAVTNGYTEHSQNQEEPRLMEDFADIEKEVEDDLDMLDQNVYIDEWPELTEEERHMLNLARSPAEKPADKSQIKEALYTQQDVSEEMNPKIKMCFDAFSELMQTVKEVS